ncbi:hypothetical protein VZT92_024996 [Zoarces viviparus]|uniref:Uncharacterized protein n=1 Tax=Zoarces viviparus TaxID=48416 RepID=A0AAW1E4I3_ZOAVI
MYLFTPLFIQTHLNEHFGIGFLGLKSSSIRVGRHAMLGVVLVWNLSLVMAAPVVHYQSIVEREDNNAFCGGSGRLTRGGERSERSM